ncbi:YceI family protein [Lysobacter terrestris]|uniref:YceI family protein n=2 Tax=Agrilutibacter terrestris TaxID=2865112 RepID=A0A7H0FZU1_9GAMM|nr:YceI family protein [Lysobacter terrestris]
MEPRTMFKPLTLAAALLFAGTAFAAPVSYKIDPNHTDVIAGWNHFGFANPTARFGQVDGVIVYDAADVAKSSVKVTIPLSGIDSGVPDLDEHLRSADFFDAATYPTITFTSTKAEAAGDNKLRVSGDLTVHGVTKPVVLDVTLNKAGEHPLGKRAAVGFDASTTIKRSEFGVNKYVPNVSDEITIRITTEAMVPKAEAAAPAKKPAKK